MNKTVMAMVLFIASEAIFFLLLVLAYVNFHKTTGAIAAQLLDPVKAGLFSIALISSSLTLYFAERSRERQLASGKWWLLATIVLGLTFLAGQVLEYVKLFRRNMTISHDLFGSTFFTLTGFHGLHVFVGILLLIIIFALLVWGRKQEPTLPGVKAVAIYWHFVDAVWVVIYSIVYLWRFV